MRSLFEGHASLLESGSSGADHVGQTAHGVGNDENNKRINRRIKEGKHPPFLRHGQISERQNQPGDGQRKHGDPIQNLSPEEPCPHDHIGDRHSEDDIKNRREPSIFQAVLDRGQGQVMAKSCLKMRKRPARGQDCAIPIPRKCHEHDSDVR